MGGDDDDIDWSIISENLRGAQDYWYWRDKPIMERSAAQSVLALASIPIDGICSRAVGQDPPDCEGYIDGSLCGVEVSELVHEKTLKSTIKGKPQYFIWNRQVFLDAVQARISRKDSKEDIKGGPYGRYILILLTDEMMLGRYDVERFLEGASFGVQTITDVILALGYDPSIKACPVFSLALVKS
ncbi:MAG: hypothetical protein KIT76_13155 [Pseudolabrys sp.]|nr:hypothetical protein [Pseudolabrys sp.]